VSASKEEWQHLVAVVQQEAASIAAVLEEALPVLVALAVEVLGQAQPRVGQALLEAASTAAG
jgi:flagellar biosynthesis/type III secretory pathway protein FliH